MGRAEVGARWEVWRSSHLRTHLHMGGVCDLSGECPKPGGLASSSGVRGGSNVNIKARKGQFENQTR